MDHPILLVLTVLCVFGTMKIIRLFAGASLVEHEARKDDRAWDRMGRKA